MQIELSNEEINLLDKALLAWEKEPESGGLLTALLAMLKAGPDASEEDLKRANKPIQDQRDLEMMARRRCATFIRAKLFSAQLTKSQAS